MLLLAACANSSTPVLQTQVIKEAPPAALLDCPAPVIPDTVPNRDAERKIMLDVAAWGAHCKDQLDAIKSWEHTTSGR